MLTDIIILSLGLTILYLGAEFLVRGSSRLALILRIPSVIIGLTIVAFGTSSPEFLVSFIAAYDGKIDLSVGNIVGSNIANIGLVLGFSVMLRPIRLMQSNVKNELYWVTGTSLLFWFFCMNDQVESYEGYIFVILLIILTVILIKQAFKERKINKPEGDEAYSQEIPSIDTGWAIIDRQGLRIKALLFLLSSFIGIVLLGYGSKLTINAAENLAFYMGVSRTVIGLTIVAFGTSLPEFATGIVSVIKKENEILLGNVIGSNLFNVLGVAGPVALFFPIPIDHSLLLFEFPLMIGFTLIVFLLLLYVKKLKRWVGFILFILYILYFIRLIA